MKQREELAGHPHAPHSFMFFIMQLQVLYPGLRASDDGNLAPASDTSAGEKFCTAPREPAPAYVGIVPAHIAPRLWEQAKGQVVPPQALVAGTILPPFFSPGFSAPLSLPGS